MNLHSKIGLFFSGKLGFELIISHSQDPTIDFQTTNPNFHEFFDQLQQFLGVLQF